MKKINTTIISALIILTLTSFCSTSSLFAQATQLCMINKIEYKNELNGFNAFKQFYNIQLNKENVGDSLEFSWVSKKNFILGFYRLEYSVDNINFKTINIIKCEKFYQTEEDIKYNIKDKKYYIDIFTNNLPNVYYRLSMSYIDNGNKFITEPVTTFTINKSLFNK
jgi:hypothetical protein